MRFLRVLIPGLCKHANVRCIHGDEIIARMTVWKGRIRRTACLDCGRALDGPIPVMCYATGFSHRGGL